ncbi:carbohydrate ABC transporter substrate-binding protein (CUT1 family) [Paenibacillus taihuensis]|uniref:Carbohydrate ABC transporter substrate-binding protein (CUT1 family) n=1 Tax=Paenibacillus taihuensis TaxID=1156355 RepID=A0A3D9SIM1_9BACL|nr:extracellular solute-binding protein [Paenibacillus taihuensis]REE92713.1 carbohydrate ABC transporter substrate-binding protein (CUT1 family) [Paenibacillus taihuensis]
MKTTTKKWLTTATSVVLAAGLLAGCGTSNNNNTTNTGDTNAGGNNATTNTGTNNGGTQALSGKLVIWTFFDQVKDMAEQFHAKNPGVTVDVKMFPGDQYQTKLLTALQSGKDVPDIFDLERGYIGKFIDSQFLTDLSAKGGDDLVKDYIPYVQALGRSTDGKLKAISDHSSPGGFWYQKDIAKKYLGTDDPDKISDMVSSWDKIIELGKKVAADSGGKEHLIQNAGDLFDIEAYNTQPWVKDGKLTIDPKWQTVYENQLKIRANNVDAKLPFMSAGWGNALNDGSVVLTSMPAWAGFMIDNKDNKANGKFGVAKTPEGFYVGGTYRGIYSKSPNQDLAYEFIKYIAGTEWQQHNLEKTGNMPGNGAVYEANLDTYKSPFFGEQNILKPYYESVKAMPAIQPDKYGEDILSKWRKAAGDGIANNSSYDDVVAAFKKEVKNTFPEVSVD